MVSKGDDGIARVIPAWNIDGGRCPGAEQLDRLIARGAV
ncbi:Type II secretion system protein E [Mycobacteroides abscessus subsp. abscessus]|nr:Type II secretion system protein E [Mycobacteroides abscessus subsp. abscessus]